MKKIAALLFITLLSGSFTKTLAEAGIFQSYSIFSSSNNSGASLLNQYYDMQATTSFPNFHNNNFGVFDLSNSSNLLQVKGGELSLYKDSGWNVTAATMNYRVFDASTSPGSFSQISFGWIADTGGNNQKWGTSGSSVNLLAGLAANKSYNIEIYFDITTNQSAPNDKRYDSNGGGNYIASFSTIPEPSSASLMILGSAALLALRRRKAA